jgi:hypothetical protein
MTMRRGRMTMTFANLGSALLVAAVATGCGGDDGSSAADGTAAGGSDNGGASGAAGNGVGGSVSGGAAGKGGFGGSTAGGAGTSGSSGTGGATAGKGGSSGGTGGSAAGASGNGGSAAGKGGAGGSAAGKGGSTAGTNGKGGSAGAGTGGSSGASNGGTGGSKAGSGGSTAGASGASGAAGTGGSPGGIFANCSKAAGCVADCAPPANNPIATGNADYDLYDGCLLAAAEAAGLTETWMVQLLKAQALNESGITPSIAASSKSACGGQNCGPWAISAGSVSGDSPPGPCGVSSTDPATGTADYSHSYGLFQSTPACEGTFLTPTLPAGVTCTGTTKIDDIPFAVGVDRFYCESATSLGVTDLEGKQAKGYINAWQTTTSPLYATSVFNPAYQIYMYVTYTWKYNFEAANAMAKGCSVYQQWYLSLAFWLTGNPTKTCTLSGAGLQYVKDALANYQTLYGKAWPYPGP